MSVDWTVERAATPVKRGTLAWEAPTGRTLGSSSLKESPYAEAILSGCAKATSISHDVRDA